MLKKLVITALSAALLLATSVSSYAKDYKEGVDYEIRGNVKSASPEIREFFSFYCGHCFMMRDQFAKVKEHFKDQAEFVMNPVFVLGGDFGVYSETAYAVANVAGVEEQFSEELFNSIHVDNEDPQSLDYFFDKLEKVGIPGVKARQSYNSFVVKGMVAAWDKMVDYAKIEAVPELMVNGKYMVKMDDINSVEDLENVVQYLLTLD